VVEGGAWGEGALGFGDVLVGGEVCGHGGVMFGVVIVVVVLLLRR